MRLEPSNATDAAAAALLGDRARDLHGPGHGEVVQGHVEEPRFFAPLGAVPSTIVFPTNQDRIPPRGPEEALPRGERRRRRRATVGEGRRAAAARTSAAADDDAARIDGGARARPRRPMPRRRRGPSLSK